MPKLRATTVTFSGALVSVLYVTRMAYVPGVMEEGRSPATCPLDAYSMRAVTGDPPEAGVSEIDVPPMLFGYDVPLAVASESGPSPLPKTTNTAPGASVV